MFAGIFVPQYFTIRAAPVFMGPTNAFVKWFDKFSRQVSSYSNFQEMTVMVDVKGGQEVQEVMQVQEVMGMQEVQHVQQMKGVNEFQEVQEVKGVQEVQEVKGVQIF